MPCHASMTAQTTGASLVARGNVTQTVMPGATTNLAYDITGTMMTASNPYGQTVTVSTTSTTNYAAPDSITPNNIGNLTTSTTYNSFLAPTGITQPNNAQSAITYDTAGRATQVTAADGAVTTYSYSGNTTTATSRGVWQRTTADGFGRATKVETGTGSTVQSTVDTEYTFCACSPIGKPSRVSQPYAPGATPVWTTFTYDSLGRTLSTALPSEAGTTTQEYTGNTVKITPPGGNWKKYTRDAFGNLVSVEEPKPGDVTSTYTTSYTYDVLDRLVTVTMTRDGSTQTRSWTYDPVTQRLASVTLPESGTTSYTYNANGTLLQKTDAKGQKVQYGYDALRRVTSIARFGAGEAQADACQATSLYYDVMYLPSTVSPNQNPYGHSTKSVTGNVTCTGGEIEERYDYTKAGATSYKALTVKKDYGGSIGVASHVMSWSRVFDSQGRLLTEYYPQLHRIDYGYDSMNRLNVMNWADFDSTTLLWSTPRSLVSNVSYTTAGQLAGMTYLGYTETRTYNALQQLTRIKAVTAEGTKMDMEYRFSATANDGRVTQSKDWVSGEEVSYQYDKLNRLIAAETTGPEWGQTYTYDGFGNMSAQVITKGNAPEFSLTVNSANNRVANWTYDANGNMVNDNSPLNPRTYMYDVENRLKTTSVGTSYAYDVANRRVYTESSGTGTYTFWSPDGKRIYEYTLQPVLVNGVWPSFCHERLDFRRRIKHTRLHQFRYSSTLPAIVGGSLLPGPHAQMFALQQSCNQLR
jgi:YD repeat-containing protein